MREILERHGPRTPTARLVLFFVTGLLGVPGLVLTLGALVNTGVLAAILVAIPSVLLTYVSYLFGSSVARRAAEAPEPEWWGGRERPETSTDESDPVTRLQRRYADGELSTDEFEHRLDRLVESDAAQSPRSTASRTDDAEQLDDREYERA